MHDYWRWEPCKNRPLLTTSGPSWAHIAQPVPRYPHTQVGKCCRNAHCPGAATSLGHIAARGARNKLVVSRATPGSGSTERPRKHTVTHASSRIIADLFPVSVSASQPRTSAMKCIPKCGGLRARLTRQERHYFITFTDDATWHMLHCLLPVAHPKQGT